MRSFLTAICFSLICHSTWAETAVPVAPPLPPPPPEWDGSAEATALITSGNAKNTTLGFGGRLNYKPLPWSFRTSFNYLISTSGPVTNAESFDALLRTERDFSPDIGPYGQLTYLTNVFTGFNARYAGEVGASLRLVQREEHRLNSELGIGAISEDRTDNLDQSFATLRMAFEYGWKLTANTEFTAGLSILENLNNLSDWRLSNSYNFTTVLTKILSMRVGFRVDHLNKPVPGKLQTDTTTTASLVAKF